jgi:fructan beta-fructosidase
MTDRPKQTVELEQLPPAAHTPKGLYKHYKGMLYEVVGSVRHSESLETMTLYRALYGDFALWVRPAAMFNETVVIDGLTQLRFTPLRPRPKFHFTPPAGWMNDPNGLVFFAGEYHLFYQCYPGGYSVGDRFNDALKWGPMHWGHAVSTDLIHWDHCPIAVTPLERLKNGEVVGMAFSGCAVIDWNNTAGFNQENEPAIIALYTQCDTIPMGNQRQGLVYSNDRGRTWQQYVGNPVLPNPNAVDFRDPKVFWHEPTSVWIMALAAKDQILFYSAPDLKQWVYLSSFGNTDGVVHGARGEPWECPDLFELPVNGLAGHAAQVVLGSEPLETRWVLLVSVAKEAANGGSGTQYFVGHFDGVRFVNENPNDCILWLDYGRDYYAAVTWAEHPKNATERIAIAWMSNWDYAQEVPAVDYRSAMAIARQLTLIQTERGIRLKVLPVAQLRKKYKPKAELVITEQALSGAQLNRYLAALNLTAYAIEIQFEVVDQLHFGFKICKSSPYQTTIAFDAATNKVYIDRTQSSAFKFVGDTARPHSAPLVPVNRYVALRILVDLTSVEVFANDGEVCLTDLHLAPDGACDVEVFLNADAIYIKTFSVTAIQN